MTHFLTEIDSYSLWEITDGVIINIAHDLVPVPVDADEARKDGFRTQKPGTWCNQESGRPAKFSGIDLDTLEIIECGHDVESIRDYMVEHFWDSREAAQ